MKSSSGMEGVLACCHGFAVRASDRTIGNVETPVFSGSGLEPDSLLVREAGAPPGAFATIAVSLVADVDADRQEVVLAVDGDEALAGPADGRPVD